MFSPVHSANRSSVMECEALYCSAAASVVIEIPSPPSLAGSADESFCVTDVASSCDGWQEPLQ